jgi:hypothetical protein
MVNNLLTNIILRNLQDLQGHDKSNPPLIWPEVGFRCELGGQTDDSPYTLEEVEKHSLYYKENFACQGTFLENVCPRTKKEIRTSFGTFAQPFAVENWIVSYDTTNTFARCVVIFISVPLHVSICVEFTELG